MSRKDLIFDGTCLPLEGNATLYCYNTDVYKRSELDIFFALPVDKYKTPLTKLMLAVLFRGSKSFPSLKHISRYVDMLYDTSLSSHDYHIGANHVNRISIKALDKKYLPEKDANIDLIGEALRVVEDILLEPLTDENGLLCQHFIDIERDFAIDGINSRLSSPKSYAAIKCNEMLFGDLPEGISMEGTEELLRSFTSHEISEIRDYFLRRSHITVYYVGTEDADSIAQRLNAFFSKIENREPITPAQKRAIPTVPYREDTKDFEINQGILRLGLTTDTAIGDDDCAAWLVYNEILGGSSTSKLFMNVREQKSLCYYCHSMLDIHVGAMAIACGIKPQNKDVALDEIKEQLRQMTLGNITDEEISYAKKGLISSLNQLTDTASAIAFSDYRYRLLTGKNIPVEQRKMAIVNVTRDDIIRIAHKIKLCSVFFLDACGNTEKNEEDVYEQDN